jgi:nucleoside-diphosphate-sugar epimerase
MEIDMSQRTHLVVGAGPIGSAVVRRAAASGDRVRVVTRSGSGPDLPGVEKVAADAADAARLAELAAGADVIYNCVNPQYHRWATDWPPVANALLAAAESSGAVLVTTSNLYGYGHVDAPMTEQTPLGGTGTKAKVRIRMWEDALAAHQAGRIRATEARGADYVGPGSESHLGDRLVPKLLAGKGVQVLGSPDTLHTWTYTEDMAMTLVALGSDERAWGRAWHVPSALECTQRDAIARLAALAGVPMPKVGTVPGFVLKALGLVNPMMRELPEVAYQLDQPFVMDSTAAQRELGLVPTPADDVLRAILSAYAVPARKAA